jgi:hypothetical protein
MRWRGALASATVFAIAGVRVAKHRYALTEKRIARLQKEQRGTGAGRDYTPWITIHDLSSSGRSTRIVGQTTGRRHELLSDGERNVCLDLDWEDAVVDIREQYPLDRHETLRIADEMRVRHPQFGDVAVVMTTDFLVDYIADGKRHQVAISVKTSADLEHKETGPRTIEKLEIERRYWKAHATPFHVVTDREGNRERSKVLLWLAEMRSLENLKVSYPGYWRDRCDGVLDSLHSASCKRHRSVLEFTQALEERNGWNKGEVLTAIRHLAANHHILIDVDHAFDTRGSLTQITLPSAKTRTQKRTA